MDTTLTVTERRLPSPGRPLPDAPTESHRSAPTALAAAWTLADQAGWELWAATAGRPARSWAAAIGAAERLAAGRVAAGGAR